MIYGVFYDVFIYLYFFISTAFSRYDHYWAKKYWLVTAVAWGAIQRIPSLPLAKIAFSLLISYMHPNQNRFLLLHFPVIILFHCKIWIFPSYWDMKPLWQVEIYESSVKPLLYSLFEGNNITIFAYGQTVSYIFIHSFSLFRF